MNLWEAMKKRNKATSKHTQVSPSAFRSGKLVWKWLALLDQLHSYIQKSSLLTALIQVKKLTKSYIKSGQKTYKKRVFNGGDKQTQPGIKKKSRNGAKNLPQTAPKWSQNRNENCISVILGDLLSPNRPQDSQSLSKRVPICDLERSKVPKPGIPRTYEAWKHDVVI